MNISNNNNVVYYIILLQYKLNLQHKKIIRAENIKLGEGS